MDLNDVTTSELLQTYMEQEQMYTLEGSMGVQNLKRIVGVLDNYSVTSFLEDNPGAVEVIIQWIGRQDSDDWKANLVDNIGVE